MSTAISAGDTAWVLVSTALVLLMLPGLALFYGGLVRARATLNTLMMSFVAVAIVTVQWVLFGYSLAFSKGGFVGGLEWIGLATVTSAFRIHSFSIALRGSCRRPDIGRSSRANPILRIHRVHDTVDDFRL